MHPADRNTRRPYSPPLLRQRTIEQAKLLLVGHAWIGNPAARDLLERLFDQAPSRDSDKPCLVGRIYFSTAPQR
jgi:hypothetical protein